MWELIVNKPAIELTPIKTDFSIKYKLASKSDGVKDENVTYRHYFDIINYEVFIYSLLYFIFSDFFL